MENIVSVENPQTTKTAFQNHETQTPKLASFAALTHVGRELIEIL